MGCLGIHLTHGLAKLLHWWRLWKRLPGVGHQLQCVHCDVACGQSLTSCALAGCLQPPAQHLRGEGHCDLTWPNWKQKEHAILEGMPG